MAAVDQRLSNNLVGIAGVHHIVSELSRRGFVALPTVRNIAAYDILVANVQGTRHANLQVKTSLKRVGFFPMPAPERIRAGPRDWYVLLRWLSREERFEVFMLTGKSAREEVILEQKRQAKRIKSQGRGGYFPCLHVGTRAEGREERWRKRWKKWRP